MAYISREFWKPDDERQALASAPLSAGSSADPGASSANPVSSAGSAQVDPGGSAGAIRSFFEANKDQGSKILSGLADGISQRVAAAPMQTAAAPTTGPAQQAYFALTNDQIGPRAWLKSMINGAAGGPNQNAALAEYNQAQSDATDASKKAAANNTATLQPIGQDVSLLEGGSEGNQTLLNSRNAGTGYTPGQSALDAWLANSAANANPSSVKNAGDAYRSAQQSASATQTYDPATSWEDYFAKTHPGYVPNKVSLPGYGSSKPVLPKR